MTLQNFPKYDPKKTKELIKQINLYLKDDPEKDFVENWKDLKKKAEQLIQEGANPNVKGKFGKGLLSIASEHTHNYSEDSKNEFCNFIEKCKLDVNDKGLISECILENRTSAASALIEMGFNIVPDKINKGVPYYYNDYLYPKQGITEDKFKDIVQKGLQWKKARNKNAPDDVNEVLALNAHQQMLNDAKQITLLGHQFGLKGNISFENENYKIPRMALESFNIVHTLPEVKQSLDDFATSDTYQQFMKDKDHESQTTHQKTLELIQETFKRAMLPHDDKLNTSSWISTANAYQKGEPVILESRWDKHSTMTVLYKDRVYICNKGVGTSMPSIKCYKIGDVKSLVSGTEIKRALKFQQLSTKIRFNKTINNTILRGLFRIPLFGDIPFKTPRFSNVKMMKELKLKKVKVIKLRGQKVGNCTYTNTKRGIDGLMLALQDRAVLDKKGKKLAKNSPVSWAKKQEIEKKEINVSKLKRKEFYHAFALHDRLRSLDKYFKRIDELRINGKLPRENGSYIEPLIRILHDQYNSRSPMNKACGQKILQKLRGIGFTDKEIAKRVYKIPDQNLDTQAIIAHMTIDNLKRWWFLKKIGLDKNLLSKETQTTTLPSAHHPPNRELERRPAPVASTYGHVIAEMRAKNNQQVELVKLPQNNKKSKPS